MFFIRNNKFNSKILHIDKRANKEIKNLPLVVQARIQGVFLILRRDGKLEEPLGKKIDRELLEIRVKCRGQWRVLYAYSKNDYIVILSAFQKKTQKTPLQEITKAKRRLKEYTI